MKQIKPMKILILEDDEYQCNLFTNCIDGRNDIDLVGITNSCTEAINFINSDFVEGVIVDLELNNGIGESGLEFLDRLNALNLDNNPIIVINTKISDELVHDTARDNGATWVFCKSKVDYSPDKVLNTMMRLRESRSKRIPNSTIINTNLETQEQRRIRISKKINTELDLIGVAHHLKGREYLFDAIYFLLELNKDNSRTYMPYLIEKHKRVNGTISNSMQTAITRTWDKTPIQDLEKYFTSNVSYKNGTPTPTEFICYYVDKLKRI